MIRQKVKKLEGLSDRQRQIIGLLIQNPGISPEKIGEEINFGLKTVTAELTAIYKALIPDVIDDKLKKSSLIDRYKDAYTTRYLNPIPIQLPIPPARRVNPNIIIIAVLGGFLIISIVVIGFLFTTIQGLNQAITNIPTPIPTDIIYPTVTPNPTFTLIPPTATVPTATRSVTPSITPIPPTSTITNTSTVTLTPTHTVSPTITLTPTVTQTYTPTITLTPSKTLIPTPWVLFEDNFDSGVRSNDWVVKGTDFIINGKLGVIGGGCVILEIGDESWKNYIVSFEMYNIDTSRGYTWYTDKNFYFFIRNKSSEHFLSYDKDYDSGKYSWYAMNKGNYAIVPHTIVEIGKDMKFEIIAKDNQFQVAGQPKFTMTGFETGGVVINLCKQAMIDNFKVVAIP